MAGISFQGDAFTSSGVLQLTRNQLNDNLTNSAGRASYIEPIHIWDSKTGAIANFISRFSFIAKDVPDWSVYGDGLTFFLAPVESEIPPGSGGGYLALFAPDDAKNTSKSRVVAVEFDSFSDPWDPGYDHVGIDVNSIVSAVEMKWNSNIYSGGVVNTWVTYESGAKNLSVFVSDPVVGIYSLSFSVDLRDVLPEWVRIGFSAATGTAAQTNKILSWEFESSF